MIRPLLLLALFALSLPLQAAFVTDRIEVPVHAEKFGQGEILARLYSGTRVDVLMKDGPFTRIRTGDGTIGWVESRLLSDEKPLGLEYLELRSHYQTLQDELAATRKRLAEADDATAPGISEEELAELRQRANDARWMKAEMNKARERARKLQAELEAERARAGQRASDDEAIQAELEALRSQNQELQERLAAALLVNEEQTAAGPEQAPGDPAAEDAAAIPPDAPFSVDLTWFLSGLLLALLAGMAGGVAWLDRRIRARHGGFRLY